MVTINQFELRLLIALLLGAAIGFERQWRHKMAGVKTNALVSLGSALFILLAAKITGDNSSSARIAAQIVTGIGFLGAGAIMKEGFSVSGLNTAATIWCSGAVGCLAGLGFWYEASIGTFFVIVSHLVLRPVENRIEKRTISNSGNSRYKLTIKCSLLVKDDVRESIFKSIAVHNNFKISTYNVEFVTEQNVNIEIMLKVIDKPDEDILLINNSINQLKDIQLVKWENVD
ncbi:MAG: MgtC/SapB family protein [Candidatus Methylacidiphilales bacterium]